MGNIMQKKIMKTYIGYALTLVLLGGLIMSPVYADTTEQMTKETRCPNNAIFASYQNYNDISTSEAWELLNDTSNGIQIPVDVRTDNEWLSERINTPFPEFPRHFDSYFFGIQEKIDEFKSLYDGNDVILYCHSGGRSANAAQILVNNNFNGQVYNMLGGITAWRTAGYSIKTGNQLPQPPETPGGITKGKVNESYVYYASASDPDNDVIRYGWDWDEDNTIDVWTEYYPQEELVNISHSWIYPGTHQIQVAAEDHVGGKSSYSPPLTIIIAPASNKPPNQPSISGPTQGRIGEEYEYTLVTTDPDENDVFYWVQWGEGCPSTEWIGPYESGEEITLTNSWEDRGNYIITAMAKDVYDETSEWATLEISMPKKDRFNMYMLKTLIERIPTTLTHSVLGLLFDSYLE
jgi:rhodanese-related sulfurtransferase